MLCVSLCFSIVSSYLPVSAEKKPMAEYTVDWFAPDAVSSVKKEEDRLSFVSGIENRSETLNFEISFPEEGGIRLSTESQGYFAPAALRKITYTELSSSSLMLKPEESNLSVTFNYGSTPWSITYSDSVNGKTFTVYSSQMLFGFDADDAMQKVKLTGTVSADETIYGLGERYNAFNQVGSTVRLWNVDTGYHTWSSGELVDSYVNVPFMHSSTGYSLFFNSLYGATADIGDSDPNTYSLDFNGTDFDFYMYLGTPLENIESYTALTGRPTTSPEWAFGYWAGGTGTYWNDEAYASDTTRLREVLQKYEEMGTMPTALYGEGSLSRNTTGYNILAQYNVKMLGWCNPTINFNHTYNFTRAQMQSLLPDVAADELPSATVIGNESADYVYVDFSNPNAVALMKAAGYDTAMKRGLKGVMVDFGEYIDDWVTFYNGMKGDEMHNFYAYCYNKTMSEVFSSKLEDDHILFARAGCAGSQTYAANFGGDVNSSFFGLKASLAAGLSISSSGFSTWGSDIGGHYLKEDQTFTDELYQRWLQFSLFSPLMRLHGSIDKNPWSFGEQAQETFKTAFALRESITDLLYSANLTANRTGAPMMQAMAVAFPEENWLSSVEDQYLFCNELMVCPVVTEGATSRQIDLPEGRWTSLWDGSLLGGGTYTVEAPVDQIPVYIREGAVIPVTLSENYSIFEQASGEGLSGLVITPPDDTRTTSYETADGETASFTSVRNGNSYTITADAGCSRGSLMLAGIYADSVTVDGVALAELSAVPTAQTGYYVDEANGQTVVNIGTAWQSIEFTDSRELPLELQSASYSNDFSDSNANAAASDFAVYFSEETTYNFVEEKASEHLTTANGTLARQTDVGGYSERDINQNIVSAVLLTRKYDDFVLDATIKGTAGGASSLGFVIGQTTPGAHYMKSAEGGYAVFFKRFGSMNLAIAYNGKTIDSSGNSKSFNVWNFAGTIEDFQTQFGVSTSAPIKVRLVMKNKTLQVYIYNEIQGKYVELGGAITLSNYSGGYIALAQSTAQTTEGASADQYFDSLRIRSDDAAFIDRSPDATITSTAYSNTFTNSSLSMLQNDFDIYYAENQLNSSVYALQSITQTANRLYINGGWLNRNYQGGNNWQPYLGNVILQYKHTMFGDVKTEFSNRFLNGGEAKSTFMTVQLGQQEKGHSAYDTESDAGGYLVTLQLCGGAWSKVTVVYMDTVLYTVAIGTEEALSTRPGYDKYVYVDDYNNLAESSFSVEVKDKKLTVIRGGTVMLSDYQLDNYRPGYVSVGFDIGNPDSGTAINSLEITGAELPVGFAEIYGSSVTLADYEGYEFSPDGINFGSETVFSGLSHNAEYVFYHRIAATESYAAGNVIASQSITVKFLPGDFNGDNLHQSTDLVTLRRVLLGTDTADTEISDVNTDTAVDIRDLVGLKKLTVTP